MPETKDEILLQVQVKVILGHMKTILTRNDEEDLSTMIDKIVNVDKIIENLPQPLRIWKNMAKTKQSYCLPKVEAIPPLETRKWAEELNDDRDETEVDESSDDIGRSNHLLAPGCNWLIQSDSDESDDERTVFKTGTRTKKVPKRASCSTCGEHFADAVTLEDHVKTRHGKGSVREEIVEEVATYPYTCKHCGGGFQNHFLFKNHQISFPEESCKEDETDPFVSTEDSITSMMVEGAFGRLKCLQCKNFTARTRRNMDQHIQLVHGDDNNNIKIRKPVDNSQGTVSPGKRRKVLSGEGEKVKRLRHDDTDDKSACIRSYRSVSTSKAPNENSGTSDDVGSLLLSKDNRAENNAMTMFNTTYNQHGSSVKVKQEKNTIGKRKRKLSDEKENDNHYDGIESNCIRAMQYASPSKQSAGPSKQSANPSKQSAGPSMVKRKKTEPLDSKNSELSKHRKLRSREHENAKKNEITEKHENDRSYNENATMPSVVGPFERIPELEKTVDLGNVSRDANQHSANECTRTNRKTSPDLMPPMTSHRYRKPLTTLPAADDGRADFEVCRIPEVAELDFDDRDRKCESCNIRFSSVGAKTDHDHIHHSREVKFGLPYSDKRARAIRRMSRARKHPTYEAASAAASRLPRLTTCHG